MDTKDFTDKTWRPTRIYSSRLEAWPTHYPEWWEPPPKRWEWRWFYVCLAILGAMVWALS